MMLSFRVRLALNSLLAMLLALATAHAADTVKAPAKDAPAASDYLRLDREGSGQPRALETAVVHLVSDDPAHKGLSVDLIAAVHVGEKDYYETLNKLFEGYDAVLYELVAPPGTRLPKGSKPGGHPVAMLQNGLKDMLGLEHQLQHIDYTKANMVHADMSPDDFAKSMSDRGESFFTMFARLMGQAMAQQSQQNGKSSEFDLFAALFDRDRAGALKRIMAEQFEGMQWAMDALDGPQGSTILSERNKVALKKFDEQVAAGKKKLAIFYGGGHMRDMEKRLVSNYRMRRDGQQWIVAWRLSKPAR
ncbi:MAG TPA: hypothetical protein VL175_03755 [Pirellulales bacterium]|jgi:hypothetical protein|nr:hypothetical protein [Pirellulales bacterium]